VANYGYNLVADKLGSGVGGNFGLALVIFDNQFEHAAIDAARCVDAVNDEFGSVD